jgi:hypothetical protein
MFFSGISKTIETLRQIGSNIEATEMNSTFRTVFFTAVVITISTFGTSLYLSAQPRLNKEQTQIVDNCNKISMAGALTVFGLLARRKLTA